MAKAKQSANRLTRKSRIVATLGPASDTSEKIEALWHAGADVFRINFSHGRREEKVTLINAVREAEQRVGRPIAIMADLQGPKLRVGVFADGGVTLKRGQTFVFDRDPAPGDAKRVCLPHKEIFEAVESGSVLLLNDGKLRFEVIGASETEMTCKVIVGGVLSDRKGVNVPSVVLPLAALTDKDRGDLDYALQHGVDWVALSFVQRPEDVAEARKLVAGRAGVLAKIEKPSAVDRIDEILDLADAVMVARGDLGVEVPVEDVPAIQRQIIMAARRAGKPVVVATQMLESMIHSPVPTRAEVTDVATAVHDGVDAIMLSAESAVGDYALEAVGVMDKVARKVEEDPAYRREVSQRRTDRTASVEDAISGAARHVSEMVDAAAVVCFTTSGSTALRAARERPFTPILTLTPRLDVARRLVLTWGLYTVKTRDVNTFEDMAGKARRMALRHQVAKAGQKIIITAGVPFGTPGATNVLHIAWVQGDELKRHKGSPE